MINFIYVTAPAFSGTTLLSLLLGAHRDIATVGEMHGLISRVDVDQFPCSCGMLIRECSFWKNVSSEMKKRNVNFDISNFDLRFRSYNYRLADLLLRTKPRVSLIEFIRNSGLLLIPRAHQELSRLMHRNEVFTRTVTDIVNCKYFLDISKNATRILHLRRIKTFNLKVIHLTRDARAVTFSGIKNSGITAEQAAGVWLNDHIAALRVMRHFPPDRWLTIRHEDICTKTDETLNSIFRFIGVSPERSIRDFRSVEQHIIGNRMRVRSSSEIKLDESWKTNLTKDQLEKCEHITGNMNRRFSYE